MKKTTLHKIKHSFLLLYIILTIMVFIIFRNSFTEINLEPKFLVFIFFGCIFIALFIIFSMSIVEILKSKETIKKDQIKNIENRIKYHKKIITDFEKELKELNE